jgi:phosphohistidine phosphatase
MTTTPMPTPTSGRCLILARHAKTEQVEGKADHDRELTPRGWRDARAMGQWLSDPSHAGVVDLVLCSTSTRTRQTLDAVLAGGVSVKEVRFDERLYGASAAHLLDVLREAQDSVDAVLIVGHAPAIPVLATALAKDEAGSADAIERIAQGFPTAALAVVEFEGPWAELAPEMAHLRDFVVPRG